MYSASKKIVFEAFVSWASKFFLLKASDKRRKRERERERRERCS